MTLVRATGGVAACVAAGLTAALVTIVLPALGAAALAVLPLAALGSIFLVWRPRTALALFVVPLLLFESDPKGFAPITGVWYTRLGPLEFADLLLAVLLLATLTRVVARRSILLPGGFTPPLALVGLAIAAGAVHGVLGGGDPVYVLNAFRALLPLVLMPIIVVNVLDEPGDVARALVVCVVVTGIKGIVGTVAWAAGLGRPLGDTTITYYGPTANVAMMLLVLGVVAAKLGGVRLSRAAWVLGAFAGAALVLSFRRSFWIATVVGLVLVVLVATRRQSRPWLALGGATIAAALWLALTADAGVSDNPVLERVQSLSPTSVVASSDDRYRLEEQRNVIAEIVRHPIGGLGLGVPWTGRYPLSIEFEGGRHYTHVNLFWFWLKLGLLGVVAYLWLAAVAVREGLRLYRRSGDRRFGASGLALAAGTVGLLIAETTGSFTGVEFRFTVVLAAAWGWLALARSRQESESATPEGSARRLSVVGR